MALLAATGPRLFHLFNDEVERRMGKGLCMAREWLVEQAPKGSILSFIF